MIQTINKTLILSLSSFLLLGCNHYKVENKFNEFSNTNVCTLKDNLLKFESGFFKVARRLEVSLETEDKNSVFVIFNLKGSDRNSSFRPESRIIFKLTNQDKNIEEIKLTATKDVQYKSSVMAVRGAYFTHYVDQSLSSMFIRMTRDQILKIANAEKVRFAIETLDEPMVGELDKGDLKPFHEFATTCLK